MDSIKKFSRHCLMNSNLNSAYLKREDRYYNFNPLYLHVWFCYNERDKMHTYRIILHLCRVFLCFCSFGSKIGFSVHKNIKIPVQKGYFNFNIFFIANWLKFCIVFRYIWFILFSLINLVECSNIFFWFLFSGCTL